MGIIINQSIRNAAISYIGIAIGFISTIKLFPNILEADQFGLTRILIAFSTLSTQFLNFGMPNAIIKFYPLLISKTDRPRSTFWVFLIPPVMGFIVYSFLFLATKSSFISWYGSDNSLLSEYYLLILPLVFSGFSFTFLTAFLKANFDTVFSSFSQDILLRLLIIISLILFNFDLINFDQFILLFIGCYLLQYISLLVYAIFKRLITFSIDFKPFKKQFNFEIIQYSFFALFSGLSALIIGNIDILMVGTFEGLSQTGIYAIAVYVGAVILVPKKSIRKISFPIISASFKENNLQNIEKLYKQTSINQFLAGYLIFIGIVANLHNLFSMIPPEYSDGAIVIIVIGIAYLFDMLTGANGQIIISSKHYRFDFYSSLLLIISSIIFNYLLIPRFGINGAAIATALSIILGNMLRVWFVWLKFKIQPFSTTLIGLILTGAIILFISNYLIILDNLYVDILFRAIIITSLYFLIIWFFKLSPEVNNLIVNFYSKVFHQKNNK